MKANFRQRMAYKFERFLNKGGSSIFQSLLIVFLAMFAIIIGIRYLIVLLFPEQPWLNTFGDHIWQTFLQLTAPGSMGRDTDSPTIYKIILRSTSCCTTSERHGAKFWKKGIL